MNLEQPQEEDIYEVEVLRKEAADTIDRLRQAYRSELITHKELAERMRYTREKLERQIEEINQEILT